LANWSSSLENMGLTMYTGVNFEFWKGKRVYLTGHTGFKGSWLSLWLQFMGAEVKGYALTASTQPNLCEVAQVLQGMESEIGDIRHFDQLKTSMIAFDPEIVIHLAAQPLVRYSYEAPIETYSTNVMGTVNVLEVARQCKHIKAIVNITTDKCYENKEWLWGYREDEPMGGFDPYSSSKGCAELVTAAYRRSFFQHIGVGLATARAGNAIGGGDWSEYRLIPDILRAFCENKPVIIRNPNSIRPWQHVLEPLSGYLMLAQALYEQPEKYAQAWNFGSIEEDAKPVNWILDQMTNRWQGASWQLHPEAKREPHEANYLKLDSSKALALLGWKSTWRLTQSIEKIVEWHQAWLSKSNMKEICLKEIALYIEDTRHLNE
jgi:CDP-glucose 4,6-dehydratase